MNAVVPTAQGHLRRYKLIRSFHILHFLISLSLSLSQGRDGPPGIIGQPGTQGAPVSQSLDTGFIPFDSLLDSCSTPVKC